MENSRDLTKRSLYSLMAGMKLVWYSTLTFLQKAGQQISKFTGHLQSLSTAIWICRTEVHSEITEYWLDICHTQMANSPAIAKGLAESFWWVVLLCYPGWDEETETDWDFWAGDATQQLIRENRLGDNKTCVYVWVCTYMFGKEGRRRICHGTALHLYGDLNFSHLRVWRLTIVTAPQAEIIRGHINHIKLDGCCTCNNR